MTTCSMCKCNINPRLETTINIEFPNMAVVRVVCPTCAKLVKILVDGEARICKCNGTCGSKHE